MHDQIVKNKVRLEWHQIVKIARDAAAGTSVKIAHHPRADSFAGVYHLHCERFIHRDIAARNVLLDDQWNAMVSDFSLSRILSPGMAGHKTVSAFGPIKWMPPEALLHQHYSSKSDAYSFGIFLWELVRARVAFTLTHINSMSRLVVPRRPVQRAEGHRGDTARVEGRAAPHRRGLRRRVQTADGAVLARRRGQAAVIPPHCGRARHLLRGALAALVAPCLDQSAGHCECVHLG